MEIFEKLINIRQLDIESEIQKAIFTVKEELKGLDEERMCKVYSSYLLRELNKRHVPGRLINTTDLGYAYEHVFILVPNGNNYYLCDLTISQFSLNASSYNASYFLVSENEPLNQYLEYVTKEHKEELYNVSDIFFMSHQNFTSNR